MTTETTTTRKRLPRVFIARVDVPYFPRLVRATSRAAVREHILAGISIEPATHDDLIALLPAGVKVEQAGEITATDQAADQAEGDSP